MKKLFASSGVLMLLFILLSGCGKKAHEFDSNYVGTWDANCCIIVIDASSDGDYAGVTGLVTVERANGPTRIKGGGSKLKIGSKKFDIDQPPAEVTSTFGTYWTMVLDGVTYTRS